MSPEQARGQAVDKRTDIWAFGCVLFEMLTGRRAFEGDTVTDTLVRILEREPEWTALPAPTPEACPQGASTMSGEESAAPRQGYRRRAARARRRAADALALVSTRRTASDGGSLGLAALLLVALGAAIAGIVRRPDPAPGVRAATAAERSRRTGRDTRALARRAVGGLHGRREREAAGLRSAPDGRRRAIADHRR